MIFTRRVYSAYIFDSYTLPFFRRLMVGAAIEKNFFWFYFFVSPIRFLLVFYFFIFSDFRLDSCFDSVFQIILFNYFDSIKIRHLILDFIFQTPYRLNSHTSFARYLLVCDSRIRFWFSTRIDFDLFQHCRFYALTLQLFISLTLLLVINKHLCLYEFGLCLFWLF